MIKVYSMTAIMDLSFPGQRTATATSCIPHDILTIVYMFNFFSALNFFFNQFKIFELVLFFYTSLIFSNTSLFYFTQGEFILCNP